MVNQYTIMEEIGRGSYGAVHIATDQYGKEFVRYHSSVLASESKANSKNRLSRNFPNLACENVFNRRSCAKDREDLGRLSGKHELMAKT